MKVAALILGLLGSFVVGIVGVLWTDFHDHLGEMQQMEQTVKELAAATGHKGETQLELEQTMAAARKKAGAAYPMVGLSLLAFVGSVLVFKLPKVSGVLLALAALVPAVLYPLTLLFGFLLLLAALFAFLAQPSAKPKRVLAAA